MSTDDTLRIGGLGSSMDIEGTIEALLASDAANIKEAEETQTTRSEKIAAWNAIKDALSAFTDAANTLRWMDIWRDIAATSSDTNVLTATAATTAPKDTYSIEVTQLARAQTIGSTSGLTTGGASPVPVTSSTLLVDIAGISAGDQFAIAGQTFTIAADDTLSSLRTKINDASASMPEDQRVTASILDNRLVLQRAQTGEDGIILSDTTGSPLQALGLLDALGEPAHELLAGQNALFTINGASVERAANTGLTDVIGGVTLNLVGLGSSTLTTDLDTTAIKTAITTFVDSYNAYAEVMESYTTYNTVDEESPVPGLLQNDSLAREITYAMRDQVTQMSPYLTADNAAYDYNGQTGIMDSLQDIGIWTTGKENRISIADEERLDALLRQEPEKMEQLFRGAQTSSGARVGGIALDAYNASRNYSSDLDGWIDVRIENINDEIDDYTDTIDKMISDMAAKESLLWEKFNAMDEAVAEMNSTLKYVKANLGITDSE